MHARLTLAAPRSRRSGPIRGSPLEGGEPPLEQTVPAQQAIDRPAQGHIADQDPCQELLVSDVGARKVQSAIAVASAVPSRPQETVHAWIIVWSCRLLNF